MTKELVTVRNLETGRVGKVTRHIAEHKIFGAHLEIVPAGTKPKVPLGGGHLVIPSEPEIVEKEEEDNPYGSIETV